MSGPPGASRRGRDAWRDRWYAAGHHGTAPVGAVLAAGAARWPATTLTFHTERGVEAVTLPEALARARRVAAGLHARGLRPGDALCIQAPNAVETTLAFLAGLHLGLVVVPVVHIYGPAELAFILRGSGARALVVPRRSGRVDHVERLGTVRDQAALETVVVTGDDAPGGRSGSGLVDWAELDRDGVAEAGGWAAPPPDATALVVYTSGSTGEPKGVRHTTNSLLACVRTGPPAFSAEPSPVSLFASPAGHIGGVVGVLNPFVTGIPGVYLDRWSAEEAAGLIERYRATRSSGAPLHLLGLVEAAESGVADLSSFHYHCCGGAAVPPSTVERADALGWRPARSYGASEHPSSTAGRDVDPPGARARTDGRPAPGVRVRVIGEDGHDVPAGTDGEVLNAGPKLFDGYVDASLDTEAFTPDGWFRTGDIGRLDGAGRLTITDRKKDVIIRGGENISSREVEDILVRHPAVVEAAVVSAPDERFGERVCAFVRLRDGASLSFEDALAHFVDQGVAKQKTPERIEPVDDLPRSPTGKVQKAALRRLLRG